MLYQVIHIFSLRDGTVQDNIKKLEGYNCGRILSIRNQGILQKIFCWIVGRMHLYAVILLLVVCIDLLVHRIVLFLLSLNFILTYNKSPNHHMQ